MSDPQHNPYSPPKASVDDVPVVARIERPRAIVLAMRLFWGSMALSIVYLVLDRDFYIEDDVPPLLMAAILVASFAFYIFLYVKVGAGANWARIVVLVLFVVAAVTAFPELPNTAQRAPVIAGIELVSHFADLFALYLVFVPGREWFRARS